MGKDIVFDFMDPSKTGTDVFKLVNIKEPRFRPTLRQYRDIERRLDVANGHIELGTKQLSDLQRKHDIQEAANKELAAQFDTQVLISRDLLGRTNAYRENADRAIRLNWYLLAWAVTLTILVNYLIWR